jgi:hypothetical protein
LWVQWFLPGYTERILWRSVSFDWQ